jgi:hypothetical protein
MEEEKKQSENDILSHMVKRRAENYRDLIQLKKNMLPMEPEYKESGLMANMKRSFEPLLREILLDTSQCTSNSHLFQGLGPTKGL